MRELVRPRVRLREYLKCKYYTHSWKYLVYGGAITFIVQTPTTLITPTLSKLTALRLLPVSISTLVSDPVLMRACVWFVEAPLYLALSAASPFLDGTTRVFTQTASKCSYLKVTPTTSSGLKPNSRDDAKCVTCGYL